MEKPESANLEKLKIEYSKLKEKYDLPEFHELNKLFDIEEIDVETDFLLRKVRRTISDRVAGYLKFIEIILNPMSSPIFFLKLINKLDNDDKKVLSDINEILGKSEVELITFDLNYDEKKEAEFVKKMFCFFNQEIKTKLSKIVEKLGNGHDVQKKEENNRSYFG